MRIQSVEFGPEREETKTVLIDKEALTAHVFFEVKEVAAFHGDVEGDENADPSNPSAGCRPLLHSATNANWIAVSCDFDASFFYYSPSGSSSSCYSQYMRLTLKEADGKIASMCWLPGTSAIVVVTTEKKMMIVDAATKAVLYKTITAIQTDAPFLSVKELLDSLELWLVNDAGEWMRWTVNIEAVNKGVELKEQDMVQAAGNFIEASTCPTRFVDVLNGLFFFFGLSSDGRIWVIEPETRISYQMELKDKCIRLHEYCNGRYLLCLTESGNMYVFEQATMTPIFIRSITKPEKAEKIVDFVCTENPNFLGEFSILVLTSEAGAHRLEVRSFPSEQTTYSARTNRATQIFVSADQTSNMLFMLEIDEEYGQTVNLRELTEMQPEKRLEKLISKRRFDEAEAFAKQFGLDLQKIYTRRIYCLVEDIELADTAQEKTTIMAKLVSAFQQLSDDNLIGDLCFSVAMTIGNGDMIAQLLEISKKRNVTDSETTDRLSSLGYMFTSYRMIFGPAASYDDVSYWKLFIEGISSKDVWPKIFESLISKEMIHESRVLWHRHQKAIISFYADAEKGFERISDLFIIFQQVLLLNLARWQQVVDFLVEDLMIALIQNDSFEAFEEFSHLMKNLISDLEVNEGNNFPDNSLHVALSFERMLRNVTQTTISPSRQAALGFYAASLKKSEAKAAIEDMATCAINLNAIKRLKEVYNYEIGYKEFAKLTPERICHNILNRQLDKMDLFRSNLEQYVKPYMAEHRLDVNATLFSYIQRMSRTDMRSYKPMWEDVCLLLADSIDDVTTRCEAVTNIASGASLPWRTQLNKAVEYLRKGEGIDANAREKLEREIQWAELMMLFQKYSVADVNLRAALKYPDVIFKLIQHIFKQKEIMAQELERLRNGLKVAEVYNKVTGKLILDQVTIDRVYIDFVSAIGQDTEICDLCTALDSLQSAIASDQLSPLPSSLSNIIGTYVDSLIRRAEQTTCHKYADDVTRRMKNLEKAGSILMRYLMQDAEYARKYDCVRRMIRLQEGYQLMASISQLNDLRWRAVKLMKYIEKPSEMNETLVVNMPNIFHFASLLGLSELETGSILLEIFATDYQTLLRILNRICSSLPDADEIMLEKCLSSCETVLLRMHELSLLKIAIERETSSRNELQQLFDYLPDLLLTLGQIAVHSHTYHGSAMRMYKYTRILRMIVNQCLLGESDNATSATSAESVTSADNKNAKEERMVMGMSRRVGCYQLRQDGSIFERIPVLTAVGVCAASVVRESSKTDEELRNYWEEAFTSLAVHQQDMIEVTARVFASSLRCFTSEPCESPLKLSHAVRNICERALQLHPCDLVTVAAYILCLPPNTIDEFVQKLRRWVSGKRAPQTHINFLRIAQFVIYVSSQADNAKYIGALVESYWARSWAKRFGKMGVGVNMQLMMSKPASILEDLSRHCIDPHIVAEYVGKWSNKLEDFNHSMLTYAMHLIMKASSSADVGTRHLALLSADGALRLLKKSENKENREFDALRTVLYVVSPYNYEVILFLVKWLSLFSFTQEENEFVFKIETLINHLHNIKRVDQVSRAECAWYVERSKALQTEKTARRPENEIYGCEMRALYERDDSTDLDGDSRLDGVSMFGSDPKANIYEREDVPLGSQPHEAVGRLPFHPFLYTSLNKIEKFLVPIVEAEVTIDSLLLWQTTLRKLPCSRRCDRLARGHLLTIAVRKKGSHAAGSGKPLSKEDAATIHSLLETTTDRKAVIFCIAMCFKKLPLCEAKIQLLELGCNVASEWLTKKDALESPLDTTEVDNINDQCIRLREAIANYKTEFILRKYGLFDERTSEKLDKPAELIGHILTDCIDWQNAHDRKEKVDVTNQLSVVSNVDINSIYSTLIDTWLKDSDAMGVIDVDMNDTMGSMSGGAAAPLSPSDETDDAELFPLPIFDVSISRIVFLLQLIRDEKPNLLRHLVAPLMEQKRDGPVDPSKCKSYIRTACVLLMAFTENDLAQAGMSLEDICVYILEKQAYIRLLDLSGLEMNVSQLLKLDKTIVVKNAINSLRSNATVLTVATCVLLDYNVADVQLIDNLLSKMIRFRKWKLAQALLLNCKQDYPSLCPHIKSLVLTWIRVFQSAIEDIESAESNMSDLSSSPVPSQTLLKWLFFLTSCPVEGGQSMRSLFGLLRARKCPVAASLVQITSDFSEKLSITLPVSDSGPVDFSFKWCMPCSTASVHTPTSSRSVQIEDVPMTDEEDI